MPLYEYRPVAASCPQCQGRFECWQSLSDPALTTCPACGQPCERVISAVSIATGSSHVLKESHFSERGFTQYRRTAHGAYEKTAGPGPEKISAD